MICSVHPNTGMGDQESKLNAELNNIFPADNVNGTNSNYLEIREDKEFLKWFGDWSNEANPDIYDELIDNADNTAIFNDQGEPRLQFDITGNPYILNTKGHRKYIKPLFEVVSSTEINSVVNTITGDFIKYEDRTVSLGSYIKMKFDEDVKKVEGRVDEYSQTVKEMKVTDIASKKKKDKKKNTLLKLKNKLNKLKSIHDNPNLQHVIKRRVLARLERYNFKYTEDVDDKETYATEANDIANFTMDSNETSNRAINDPKILSFLSSVPVFENYDQELDKQRPKVNILLSSNEYMDQNAVWSMIEGIFADIIPTAKNKDIFENFLLAITHIANTSKHPELNYISEYLNNLSAHVDNPTEFKVKLVGAFFKSTQNYLITQIEQQEKQGGKYVTTFKVIDPAVKNNKIGKLTDEYIETISSSKAFENRSEYNAVKKKLVDGYDLGDTHVNGYNDIKGVNDYDAYYKFLNEMLNSQLGLDIAPEIIRNYIDINTVDGFDGLRNEIDKFLVDPIQSKTLENHVLVYPNGEFDLLTELRLAGGSKSSSDAKDAFKDRLQANGSFLKGIAAAAKLFTKDVSESSFMVGGSQRWAYSYTSGLNMEIAKWKTGDLSSLKRLANRGLKFVDHLLKDTKTFGDRIEMLTLYTNSEIKKKNDSAPSLHKRITEVDYHLDNFIKMFNSKDSFYEESTDKLQNASALREKKRKELKNYILYNFGADKNSLFALYGLPNLTDKRQVYNPITKEIGEDLKIILNDYVAGELRMAQQAGEMIDGYFQAKDKKDYLMKHLIPGYHYNIAKYTKEDQEKNSEHVAGTPKRDIEQDDLTAEDFIAGNYHKIGIFTSSLDKFMKDTDGINPLLYDYSGGYPVVRGSFYEQSSLNRSNESLDTLMAYVYNDINDAIQNNFKYLNNIILIKKENEKGEMDETKLFELENNMRTGEMEMSIYKYIIGSFLNNYELSNIFNGHVAFYKQNNPNDINLTDFLKRAPAVATDGKYLYHRNTKQPKHYYDYNDDIQTIEDKDDSIVIAIVNDIDIKKSIHADLISKATGQKLSFKHELADGQGYVTPGHFKDIIERIYGWNEHDDKMFAELTDPSHKITDENIRWIKTASKSYTPLKMVHFEVNENNMPIYLKYSIAPLFPSMTSGTEMQKVLDQMEAQGVEQLVFKSGSKASNHAPTTIHNVNKDQSYGGVKEGFRFNPFVIDSTKTKMQVELPTKLDKQTKIGMQSVKNILTNINMEDTTTLYEFRGKKYTGAEIYDKINTTAVTMLQNQLNELLKELGYTAGKFKKESIKNLLKKQLDIETESDLIHLLNTDLPLETIPNFGQRAFPVIAAFIAKKAGKLYTNGASVVQVANMGYDRITQEAADGIVYLSKQRELAPPLPETDKDGNINYYDPETGEKSSKADGGVMRIKKAKILLPFSSIFEKTGMSYEDFQKAMATGKPPIDKRIFTNIMGYRIPNQSMSSNDSFEIVGILPPIAGDQAIVYHEITAKTGSDFDIDKMYLALPNYKVNKVYKIPADSQALIKELKKAKVETTHLSYFMEFMTDTGTELLDNFRNNSAAIDKYVRENHDKPGQPNASQQPLKFILHNLDEFRDILQHSDDVFSVDNEDGTAEEIKLLELLEDVENAKREADAERDSLLNDRDRENAAKIKQIYKDHGYLSDEVSSIDYVTDGNRGMQNEFIELLNSILESPASYNDLMAPLDSTIIKDTIHKIEYLKAITEGSWQVDPALTEAENVAVYTKANAETGLLQMFPVSLLKSRVDVLEAKTLISIMANNMTDMGESQKVGFGLKYPLGIVSEEGAVANSLAREFLLNKEGDNEFKLSKIVSYLMNASVDAAKDNYIISGNFTSYTANGAMLMVRLGMPLDDLFTVLMNKEILNFSRYKTFQKAKTSDFAFDYNQEQLDEWSKDVLNKLSKNNWDIFKVIPKEDFLGNNPAQKEAILGYWNLIQTVGKEFNDAVVAFKSDSNSAGSNIPEFIALKNRISKVMNGTTVNGYNKWFKNGMDPEKKNRQFDRKIAENPNVKILGAMANNTLFLMEELSKDFFIETTKNVQAAVDNILTGLGTPYETSVDNIKLVYNYLYPYLLSETKHKIYDISKKQEKYLLGGEFTKKLVRYKVDSKNNFLKQLDISTNKKKNLIKFPNFKNFSVQDKLDFKEAFTEMMNDSRINNPNDEYYGLIDDLVQYAFLTTGFKSTFYSFNELIPASYFLNSMHGKAVQNYIEKLNDPARNNINYVEAMTLMAQAHHNNYKIVKRISVKLKRDNDDNPIVSDQPISNEKTLKKLSTGEDTFLPFFKKNKTLYMLTDKKGKFPVYTRISKHTNAEFNTYSFRDIPEGLILDSTPYISAVEKLYADAPQYIDNSILQPTTKCK